MLLCHVERCGSPTAQNLSQMALLPVDEKETDENFSRTVLLSSFLDGPIQPAALRSIKIGQYIDIWDDWTIASLPVPYEGKVMLVSRWRLSCAMSEER